MKSDTFSSLDVFVIVFGLDPAQATLGLAKCWSNWPIENIPIKLYLTRSVNVKEKIVQGCAPTNINCSSFIITLSLKFAGFPNQFPVLTMFSCARIMFYTIYCAVPENIHIPPMEGLLFCIRPPPANSS